MQFSCESCKATLRIADEKVRGKRLVVRCKKCGARIQIADPALGPAPAGAAAVTAGSAPPPARAPAPAGDDEGRDSDIESTQAMDSGVLEKALRASKVDDATPGLGLQPVASARAAALAAVINERPSRQTAPPPAPSAPVIAPPPPAEPPAPARPRDPPVWFAMLAGKQTGPLSRAELGLKVAQGTATPRTYLWKEGMNGWQRAQDVAELSALFAAAPAPKSEAPAPVPGAPNSLVPGGELGRGIREFSTGDFGEVKLSDAAEESRRGRQRVEPEFAKHEFGGGFDLGDGPISNSGIDIPLDLDAPAPARQAPPVAPKPSIAPAPKVAPKPAPKKREMSPDPSVPVEELDEDDTDRTHVEPLPLGERVHQEEVAKELFSSSGEESPVSISAKDLASWASKELGRKPSASAGPSIPKAPVPSEVPPARGAPRLGGAATRDPFAAVPDSPDFSQPDPLETTGNIIERLGVKKKRTGTLVAIFGGAALVIALIIYALASGERNLGTPQKQAERKALGGTGESVSGLTQGKTSGLAASGSEANKQPKKVAVAQGDKPKADDAAAAAAAAQAAQDAQALAALGSDDHGIGSHGPKVDATANAPDTSKADTALSADDIKKKLGENKGALQSCIDDALHKNPNLRVGKIHIATTIAPSGTVTSAKIDKRNVDDSPLGACLKKATRRIVFPSFQGEEFEVDIPILVTAGD